MNNQQETKLSWTMNGQEVSTDSVYMFIAEEMGNYKIDVKASNEGGETSANVSVEVYGKYKYGTFVLNEGQYLKGDVGTLVFISPKGVVTDSVYYRENGGLLGFATQDLYIQNHKMYIVAQEGGNDGGYLTVLNAETMKKVCVYQNELDGQVTSPTHVVALSDDEIYLRDGEGIKLFRPSTGDVTLISGSEGARKNRMAVVAGKIFAPLGSSVIVIESGETQISGTITFDKTVSGVIRSFDGNLWVSDISGKISKVDSRTNEIIDTGKVADEAIENLGLGWGHATPNITAKGDTIYMTTTKNMDIYRYIFSTGETQFMVNADDLLDIKSSFPTTYNTAAVHPITGEVYMNILESYSFDPGNHIAVFDFSDKNTPKLKMDYQGYTVCPAGIFFTYDFE